jgi:hypothetical protein
VEIVRLRWSRRAATTRGEEGEHDASFEIRAGDRRLDGPIRERAEPRENDAARTYRVSYGELTAPLVKAIQEQQAEISTLAAENAETQDAACGRASGDRRAPRTSGGGTGETCPGVAPFHGGNAGAGALNVRHGNARARTGPSHIDISLARLSPATFSRSQVLAKHLGNAVGWPKHAHETRNPINSVMYLTDRLSQRGSNRGDSLGVGSRQQCTFLKTADPVDRAILDGRASPSFITRLTPRCATRWSRSALRRAPRET